MPECEKHGVPVLIGGDNPPFLVGIGLTDLPTIGRGQLPPCPLRHHCEEKTANHRLSANSWQSLHNLMAGLL